MVKASDRTAGLTTADSHSEVSAPEATGGR